MTLSKRTAKGWEGGSGSDSEGGALLPVSARAPGPPPPARRLGARAASVAVAALALFGVAVYALGTPARHAAAGLLAPEPSPQFVTVRDGRFMDGCRPFTPIGFSVENLMLAGIPEISAQRTLEGDAASGREALAALCRRARAAGATVLRGAAHTLDPAHPLQVAPGEYSEEAFLGLDWAVASAAAAGLRLSLSLADNWLYRGGADEIVDWSPSVAARDPAFPPLRFEGDLTAEKLGAAARAEYEERRHARFFVDAGAKALYKAHVAAVLGRRNTFTGRLYRDEPAIFSFGLLNEPRCYESRVPECAGALAAWVEEMAAHFRALDANHLLTIGEEGFYAAGGAAANPGAANGSDWAARAGQDFIADHEAVDYATIHVWPDNWSEESPAFRAAWLARHAADAAARLGKPLLLEEAGRKLEPAPAGAEAVAARRDPVFGAAAASVERALAERGALAGWLFWQVDLRLYAASPPHPYAVEEGSSTWAAWAAHAARVAAHGRAQPPDAACAAAAGAARGGCWAPLASLWGAVRQCRPAPAACAALRAGGRFDAAAGRLAPPASQAFATREECCRPGAGAFAEGCNGARA